MFIQQHKIESGLIVFSVTIVVCVLILLFGINNAGKEEIIKMIKKGGDADKVLFSPDVCIKGGLDGFSISTRMSFSELQLIKNGCSQVKTIAFYNAIDVDEMKIEKREYLWTDSMYYPPIILGTTPESRKGLNLTVREGRFINDMDMRYKRKVCVLGAETYNLLGKGEVIGKKLITKNPDERFTIIGVLEKNMPLFTALPLKTALDFVANSKPSVKASRKTEAIGLNAVIYIPFPTGRDFFKEINIDADRDDNALSMCGIIINKPFRYPPSAIPQRTFIFLGIDTPFEGGEKEERLFIDKEAQEVFGEFYTPLPERLKEPIDDICRVLRKKYGDDKYFRFTSCGRLRDELHDQIDDANALLRIVILFSLLLSAIIISSMMLLSAHNRVSEIGIRRAFGARKRDIFFQFLSESMVVCSTGIIIGLVAGILLSYFAVVKMLNWEYSIPWHNLVLSSVIPFVTGIISSLYPAMKAANISPTVAVKYE